MAILPVIACRAGAPLVLAVDAGREGEIDTASAEGTALLPDDAASPFATDAPDDATPDAAFVPAVDVGATDSAVGVGATDGAVDVRATDGAVDVRATDAVDSRASSDAESDAEGDACPLGSSLNIVAHEDDDLLFLNPDIAKDIQAGVCVRTVFVTAGDANLGQAYWEGRELGAEAAYATMASAANEWTGGDAPIGGVSLRLRTLSNRRISLVFVRLPDGFPSGEGGSQNNYESLQKLWEGRIAQIHPVPGADGQTAGYTKQDLLQMLGAIIADFRPQTIRTQDYLGTYGDGDHSDHHAVAFFVRQAHAGYLAPHLLVAYQDYSTSNRAENLSAADQLFKTNVFKAYLAHDAEPCGSPPNCGNNSYTKWLKRQYTLETSAW